MSSFRRIFTDDQNLQLIQDNIVTALTPVLNGTLSQTSFVQEISLGTGADNLVEHGLPQVPRGFLVASLSANSTIWTQFNATLNGNANSRFMNLRCSANCIASFIFF